MKNKTIALLAALCLVLLAGCAGGDAPESSSAPEFVASEVSSVPEPEPLPEPESLPQPEVEDMDPAILVGSWDVAGDSEDGMNIPLYRLMFNDSGNVGYGAGWLASEWAAYHEGSYTVQGDVVVLDFAEALYGEGDAFSITVRVEPDTDTTRVITLVDGSTAFPYPSAAPTVFTDADTLYAELLS